MRIDDEFRVSVPVEDAWRVLLDLERIAPCLPGAQLDEVEGDEYRGRVKVKVGPITAQYQGSAKLDALDEANRSVVIRAMGRDSRGAGNASATISASMRADGDATVVTLGTDLAITGKVAQLGRGVLADVSERLLAEFVDNLERDVLTADAIAAAGEGSTIGSGGDARQREAQPVDLIGVAGAPLARRLAPLAFAGVALLLLWSWRRRRRRRRDRG